MKILLATAALALSAMAQSTATAIFVLPMPGNLDQFLAVHLSESPAYRVVTDPTQATLILTDRVGDNLEQTLKAMAAPPAAKDDTSADNFTRSHMQPLTHSRGTLFLVDRASHQVLWSTFEEQKLTDSKSLDRSAKRIVDRLSHSKSAK